MFDPAQVPPVSSDELLARFIVFSKHIRSSNMTDKPDAFMPHPLIELPVTGHREATEDELWHGGSGGGDSFGNLVRQGGRNGRDV